MFNDMEQFLQSDFCLSCQGCCQFDQWQSDWRPKVGASEAQSIKKHTKSTYDNLFEAGYIKDTYNNNEYNCIFLETKSRHCAIYATRPFECRLYPFVLTYWQKSPSVCIHQPCPFTQQQNGTETFDAYLKYLQFYFQMPHVKTLLKMNPHLFGVYAGYEHELKWLFDVCL